MVPGWASPPYLFRRRSGGRMPFKPARQCRSPFCPNLTLDASGFCDVHASLRQKIQRGIEHRGSSSRRGYGYAWQQLRREVLTKAGIPEQLWPLYDIDHNPRYNAIKEPDHRKYQLIPRLRSDHSRKTIHEDGGLGRRKSNTGGGVESLGLPSIDRSGYPSFHSGKIQAKGVIHG